MIYSFGLLLAFYNYILASAIAHNDNSIMIIGSINADIIIPFYNKRFPDIGETIVTNDNDNNYGRVIPGGKGANQAVACSRLGLKSFFICQFGDDYNAKILEDTLIDNNVDLSYSDKVDRPSGLGLIFMQDQGSVSAVVVGGSNAAWPSRDILMKKIENIFNNRIHNSSISCIMLQMEIPQYVNELIAEYAFNYNIPVFQDIGGEEREISSEHLKRCTYISPNLTELKRLTKQNINTENDVIHAAKYLQSLGANNVLVTLGSNGSLLLTIDGEIYKQTCCPVDQVLDETGAGDNYRAAFVTAYYGEKKSIQESMEYASISGALAVTKIGAIPACTTKMECMDMLNRLHSNKIYNIKGGHQTLTTDDVINNNININENIDNSMHENINNNHDDDEIFPYKFASRLNSMKDRQDLCLPHEENNHGVFGWISRQGRIKGLDLIDFNYPQHIESHIVTKELKDDLINALDKAGLKCGAICLRYPKSMQAGALTNPNKTIREEAIQLTKEACEWAIALNTSEVVIWSAFDGYDYSLQVNYHQLWDDVIHAFQNICDSYPSLKISLEYKPTDENTRFFAVPSTGSAQMLVHEVNRNNFGLTLDFGHCLMAGENPAQSVAYVNRRDNKLYGVQLGDGYGRLGAEDGLAFGSIHTIESLEFIYWLIKTNYSGHIYFDTFPRNEDPIRECEYNIRQFKKLYYIAKKMLNDIMIKEKVEDYLKNHDAMSMLELIEVISSFI